MVQCDNLVLYRHGHKRALGMYDATMAEQEVSAQDGADIPPSGL